MSVEALAAALREVYGQIGQTVDPARQVYQLWTQAHASAASLLTESNRPEAAELLSHLESTASTAHLLIGHEDRAGALIESLISGL